MKGSAFTVHFHAAPAAIALHPLLAIPFPSLFLHTLAVPNSVNLLLLGTPEVSLDSYLPPPSSPRCPSWCPALSLPLCSLSILPWVSTITFSISFHSLCIQAPFTHCFPRPFFPDALYPLPPPPGKSSCLFLGPHASLQLHNPCYLRTCIGSSLLCRAVLTLDTCFPSSPSSHVLCGLFLSQNHSLSLGAFLLSQPHIVGFLLAFPWSASPD